MNKISFANFGMIEATQQDLDELKESLSNMLNPSFDYDPKFVAEGYLFRKENDEIGFGSLAITI